MFIVIVLGVCIGVCGGMLLYRYITQWYKNKDSSLENYKSSELVKEKSYVFYEDERDIREIKGNVLYYRGKNEDLLKKGSVKVEDEKVYTYDSYMGLDKKEIDEYRIDGTSVFLRCFRYETECSPDNYHSYDAYWHKKKFLEVEDGCLYEDAIMDYWKYKYSESNNYNSADIKKMQNDSIKWLKTRIDWHELTDDYFLYIFILYNRLSKEEFLRYARTTYEILKKADVEYTKLFNDFDKLPCYDPTNNRHKLYTKTGKPCKDKKKNDEFNKRYDEIISKIDGKYFRLENIIDKHSDQMQVLKNMIKIAKED